MSHAKRILVVGAEPWLGEVRFALRIMGLERRRFANWCADVRDPVILTSAPSIDQAAILLQGGAFNAVVHYSRMRAIAKEAEGLGVPAVGIDPNTRMDWLRAELWTRTRQKSGVPIGYKRKPVASETTGALDARNA